MIGRYESSLDHKNLAKMAGRFRLAGSKRGCHNEHDGCLWTDDLYRRISALPGAALDWQVHPALVWRGTECLDHVHAVFPSHVVGWLRLRARVIEQAQAQVASQPAFGINPGGTLVFARCSIRSLGAQRQ